MLLNIFMHLLTTNFCFVVKTNKRVNEILQLLLRNGARMAEPGEFTKRAFLNGRMDLSQAEAVMDLIRAKTDQAMTIAVQQLDGSLSTLINNTRQNILETLAQVEVNSTTTLTEADHGTRRH